MTENDLINKRRDIRIVGYDKRLLIAQILLVAAVLCLPAMALAPGWGAGVLCVVFFGLILAVFVQLWTLRKTGLRITVEDVESQAAQAAEETPAEEEPVESQAEETPPPSEREEEEPHWSDHAYPDPDVELGLNEDASAKVDAQWRQTSPPDSEEKDT